MAGTWSEVVTDALIEIGVKTPGEALDATELTDSMRRLQGMLGEWGMQGLLVPGVSMVSHTVVESKGIYTLGLAPENVSDASPDIVLPSNIETLYTLSFLYDGYTYPRPIKSTNFNVLAEIRQLDIYYPTYYFYDRSHPFAHLYLDRSAQVGDRMDFAFRGHFGNIVSTDNITDMVPAEFREAILLNLAIKLAPSYGVKDGRGQGLSTATIRGAHRGLAYIRKRNLKEPTSKLDPALMTYNTNQLYRGGRGYY